MVDRNTEHKIMQKPLPQILDDMDDSIRLSNEATARANDAADSATKAGEKAGNEARLAAEKAIAGVEAKLGGSIAEAFTIGTQGVNDAAAVRKIAEEALALAKAVEVFARRINLANVNSLEAGDSEYKKTITS